ncbi:MAG: hypothetical protein RI101_04355 [Nitrospira sp.]|jgi:hypothetical protein|nr:hypothetical protein [Nitrospira sp.]
MMRVIVAMGVAALAGLCSAGVLPAADVVPAGRVEVVLANEHRAHQAEIVEAFAASGLTNLHVQFMKAGKPPANIGFGPKVAVERAQAAMRMAKQYNGGIAVLLPERLFPDQYVTIASSSFDDTVEYPVSEEALKELERPGLTTEQFHELYRRLTPAEHVPVKKGRVFE